MTQNRLTIAGESFTIREWAQRSGTPYFTIKSRLRRGFSDSAAVFGEKFTREKVKRESPAPPAHFPVTAYNRWGGCQSITFWRVS